MLASYADFAMPRRYAAAACFTRQRHADADSYMLPYT